MKMIYAIVRPEKVYEVNKALADAGYGASTKWSVAGRGKQHGIKVGELVYDEMSKNMLMIVCDDDDKNEAAVSVQPTVCVKTHKTKIRKGEDI